VVCYGDFEQLKQAMLNLVLNAIQAMPDGGDLEIHVGTDSEKELVTLCIADDGQGIPTDIQEKIFTPFFTTKPTGTGLGLHTVNRIVQAHYGRIRVVSAEGTGTQFVVELPRDARQLQPPVFQVGIEPIQAVN
jgi:signal transduction histidine kinase